MSKCHLVKLLGFIAVIASAFYTYADTPQIRNVTAKQRYPWNGLVDITCTVSGIDGTTNGLKFAVAAVMPDSGEVRRMSQFWVVQNGTNSTDRKVHTNGDYRLVWDAQADLGAVIYSNMVMRVTVIDHDKVQLWEGGPYWADTNIGAENPEDYGYYFWWGDTIGYKRENNVWVASDGSVSGFSFSSSNTPTYNKTPATLQSEGWITAASALTPEHDAAHVKWGGNWRMPTRQELSDLNGNCDWTWTTKNGVNGYEVRGRGEYVSNSIFLPCAGYGYGTSLIFAGSRGYYWSSVPDSDGGNAWCLGFYSSYHGTDGPYRIDGFSVRPVQGFTNNVVTCAITLDRQSGNGGTASVTATYGSAMPSITIPIRSGYTFGGYYTGTDGSGTQYYTAYGASARVWDLTSAMTLYAKWTANTSGGHEKVQLWEGGPYWATTNIGAENPEDYGYYFWWGDTVGYKRVANTWVANDGSSSNFSFSNTQTFNKSVTTLKREGWITADKVLTPEHDAAHVQWGGSWRMPTKQELDDLNSKCNWTRMTMNGVNGYIVRGRDDYASASIFLPCAGFGLGTSIAGSYGYYWSSVPNSDSDNDYGTWYLAFGSGDHYTAGDLFRSDGASVRPVQGFAN